MFPRTKRVVHQGAFFFPDQEVVIVAEQELKESQSGMRAKNGRGVTVGYRESFPKIQIEKSEPPRHTPIRCTPALLWTRLSQACI
jgi:hypothetical protein